MNQVEQKLAAARTRLILDKPFLGALVLRLPLVEAEGNWCASSATDAKSLYYNANYMESLSLSQVQFVLAHEALHCGLSHFARRNRRDLNRWNIACDYAVNLLLTEDGLELPPGALLDETYKGLSAEEIYPLIAKDSDEETLDQHLYDNQPEDNPPENHQQDYPPDQPPELPQSQQSQQNNQSNYQQRQEQNSERYGAHQSINAERRDTPESNRQNTALPPPPLTEQEREKLNTQWQQRLAGAAQQALQAGKMKGSVARLIERLIRSTVPWRTVLARYMSSASRQDYNITRPSQRREGDAILPSLYSRQTNMVIALDTSGSIEDEELAEFIAEVNAIKSLVNARITLLACDAVLDPNGPWIFEPWEQLVMPKTLTGGGGTDFSPVFDWLAAAGQPLDLMVYFTDANGRFPPHPPITETLWLVKGGASVPFGQRIQLN